MQVVMGIKMKNKGIVRCHALQITDCGTKQLKSFFEMHIAKDAKIKTDKWREFRPLKNDYKELKQDQSNPKQNFKLFHRQVMMIKEWLRVIHHSVKNLQPYLNEFCYRSNRGNLFERIFNNITARMIYHQPVFINQLKME